jgi:ribosomal protein L19
VVLKGVRSDKMIKVKKYKGFVLERNNSKRVLEVIYYIYLKNGEKKVVFDKKELLLLLQTYREAIHSIEEFKKIEVIRKKTYYLEGDFNE